MAGEGWRFGREASGWCTVMGREEPGAEVPPCPPVPSRPRLQLGEPVPAQPRLLLGEPGPARPRLLLGEPGPPGPASRSGACRFQALHRCQLKHTIALWQLLSAHRSEQLLRLHKVGAAPPRWAGGPLSVLPASLSLPPFFSILGALQGNQCQVQSWSQPRQCQVPSHFPEPD